MPLTTTGLLIAAYVDNQTTDMLSVVIQQM